jgi:DNA (cytosine-5)-methyltransferase 1
VKQLKFRLPAGDLLPGEIMVDLFAGGGGASHGIEMALGRSPDIAINHDPAAIAMHTANHPATRHFREDVWKANIAELVGGRPVGLLWASPDCRHFSRAKGGKPVSKRVRSLASVVVKYAKLVRPRVICLENVPEFLTWGPLGPDSMPIKAREGEYFAQWARGLARLGYVVDKKVLNAADFGAPTSRKRIFVVARRDGLPIAWPAPSHGPGRGIPYRTAAECIDWSIPCPSIFERARPLADATLRRIARGIVRYVLNDPKPFIVNLTHGGRLEDAGAPLRTVTGAHRGEKAVVAPAIARIGQTGGNGKYCNSAKEPISTVTTKAEHCLVAPTLVQTSYGERKGQAPRSLDLKKPLGTVVAGGTKHALCAAFLAKHYGGVVGQTVEKPLGTVTKVDHHSLVAASLTKFYGTTKAGAKITDPAPTATNGGNRGGGHVGIVAAHLTEFRGGHVGQSPDRPIKTITGGGGGAGGTYGLVLAFLLKYYGTAVGQKPDAALDTITAKARFGVVTVSIDGEEYAIADIGMRMLQPHELARAQGFPPEYVLTGTKSQQVAKIGNSVCPPVAAALVRANLLQSISQPLEAIA